MGLEIGKTVDGYEIVEVLGSSKTGVAYKVRNVFAQRFEVLKVLPKNIQDDDEQNARFLREIKVHAQLLHPNIVTFYNAREMDGQLVMTTEFVPGADLAKRLEAGPIAWREACDYAGQVLSALGYAHAHGIVHRGLSSGKLILTPEGNVRLTGFGLAKSIADPELTAAGSVIGALKYMAPEQVKGESIDGRSDLYSLGIVLYEMLTGKLPFAAKGQFEIMLAHVNTAPKHASDVNPDVPRELGDAVAKALAKSPDDRFQTAQEFRTAVERVSYKPELVQEALAPVAEPLPSELPAAPVQPETPAPVLEASRNDAPTPVSSREPWDAWSFEPVIVEEPTVSLVEPELPQPVLQAGTVSEAPSEITDIEPSPETVDTQPILDPGTLLETPAPPSSSMLWDAHAIEAALLSAQAHEPAAEPEPVLSEPVSQASALSEDPPEIPGVEPSPETVETHAALDAAAVLETPAPAAASVLWDAHAIEAALLSAQVHEPPPVFEPAVAEAPSVAEFASHTEAPVPAGTNLFSDSWLATPDPAPVASYAPTAVATVEPVVEKAPAVEVEDPVASSFLWDAWAISSAPETAELPHSEPVAASETPEPVANSTLWESPAVESPMLSVEVPPAPEVTEPAASLTPPAVTFHDPWAFTSKALPLEAALGEAERDAPPPVVAIAEGPPAAAPPLSLFNGWSQPESTTEPAALQPPHAEPPALTPSFDWNPSASNSWQSTQEPELQLFDPPFEPLPPRTEEPAPPLPVLSQESQAVDQPLVSEPLTPSPQPEAAAAVSVAPVAGAPAEPVVKAMRPPSQDLLTALFGDTLLSRLSLALVVCAITFFLGTVTLFAVLSVTKP